MQDEAADAMLGKCFRGGGANPPRGARNERSLSIESPVHDLKYKTWIGVRADQAEADCWFRNQSCMASRYSTIPLRE